MFEILFQKGKKFVINYISFCYLKMDKLPLQLTHTNDQDQHHGDGPQGSLLSQPHAYQQGNQPPYMPSHATMMAAAAMYNQLPYSAMYHQMALTEGNMMAVASGGGGSDHYVPQHSGYHHSIASSNTGSSNASNIVAAASSAVAAVVCIASQTNTLVTPPHSVGPLSYTMTNTPPLSLTYSKNEDRKPSITNTPTPSPGAQQLLQNDDRKPVIATSGASCIQTSTATTDVSFNENNQNLVLNKNSIEVSLRALENKKNKIKSCSICHALVS